MLCLNYCTLQVIFPWLKLGEMITCYDPLTHRVLSASIIKTDGYSILVRYKNFAEIYNEWIDRDSPRIKSPSQGQKIMVVDGTALAKVLQKEQVTFYSWVSHVVNIQVVIPFVDVFLCTVHIRRCKSCSLKILVVVVLE